MPENTPGNPRPEAANKALAKSSASKRSALERGLTQAPTDDGRIRAVIDAVQPVVDGGRFAVKRVAGESFEVTAHCFADGHDVLRVMLRWRLDHRAEVQEVRMEPLGNDVWSGAFAPPVVGRYLVQCRRLGRRVRILAVRAAAPGRHRRHPDGAEVRRGRDRRGGASRGRGRSVDSLALGDEAEEQWSMLVLSFTSFSYVLAGH